ncbi:MAG: ribonuclease H-like domain-containing protein, partial [Halodesulfurarchaeum sp.]
FVFGSVYRSENTRLAARGKHSTGGSREAVTGWYRVQCGLFVGRFLWSQVSAVTVTGCPDGQLQFHFRPAERVLIGGAEQPSRRMAAPASLDLLSLPSQTLDGLSLAAVRDAIEYFDPALIAIPGPIDPQGYATVRQAAADRPVDHPQLAQRGTHVQQYGYTPETGIEEKTDGAGETASIDVISVQNRDLLDRVAGQLTAGERHTDSATATYLHVPQLRVEREPTTLSTTLPAAHVLARIATTLPESVTVLAGGMPATYHHEWSIAVAEATVTVPVAGLGATDRGPARIAQHTLTARGGVAAEAVEADRFGLQALAGIGEKTADRLAKLGHETRSDVRRLPVSELQELPGIGRSTAERMHAHAEVIDSGEPLVLTNTRPVKTRDDRPPLCLDIETDGLSPTIIWQFGVYDPATDRHQSFIERNHPRDPKPVLEAFLHWLLANHADRTLLTWNGYGFDYRYIRQFIEQHLPQYVEAWENLWKYDLYKWAVRDGNALLPGRTNKLDHVARALGYDGAETGLTGAQTAAAYQGFMRDPTDPDREPDWARHEAYCEDDCRALWHVYQSITAATRRDVTDNQTGKGSGQQAGLTEF